ncbi:MAG TPA: FAD-binding oxidoreductase [Acidobacteriota bacterium]|nr:FAD-binding oxidoreductase [Acidobacteriota bacterium]
MKTLLNQNITKLQNEIKGRVLLPGSSEYEEARQIWNAMITKWPSIIVRCADADDVPRAISFARENKLEMSVRGAGHNIAGNALCDSGLTIDLSGMKNVRIDAKNLRAHVGPGATLGDFDMAAQAYGLATPVGINSTTGISGLTLGGGFGWLTRKHGLTIDNLLSADVITADGQKITASENHQEDLFWAIRGGGGNFGVVTQFEFQLHPVGPEVLAGLIVFPFSQAKQVLSRYRGFVDSAPLDLNVWAIIRHAPPLPFLPAETHGKMVMVLAVFYAGPMDRGLESVQTLRRFGDVMGEQVGPLPYVQWQKAFDALLTPGARNYWKSHNFNKLDDGALELMVQYGDRMPTQQCELFLGLISGVANDVPADATAYSPRDAKFVLNVHGRWDAKNQDQQCVAWAREFFRASAQYASSGAYVNFMTEDESTRVESAYGVNYARLRQLKRRYDPENLFHFNQNIKP